MKSIKPVFRNFFLLICLIYIGSPNFLQAQREEICKDDDCSPDVFKVQLNEPLTPPSGTYSAQRTQNFIAAYKSFQQVKNTYATDVSWRVKKESSQIGGKSCLRHYQLESKFANEYINNPEFKKFIDANASNADTFAKDGFKNGIKGNNLKTRMASNCPDKEKEANDGNNFASKDIPLAYQNIGTHLGYFDKKGNVLKPVEQNNFIRDLGKLSKRKQVEALKEKVNQIPVGTAMKDKLGGISSGLKKGLPKLGLFKKAMGLMNSKLATFLPGPMGLVSKIKTGLGILNTLKKFKPKKLLPGLFDKIGNLFKRGEGLSKRAKGLADKANGIKDKLGKLGDKGKKLENELQNRLDKIKKLEDQLSNLEKKKNDLVSKLGDKPKKILDELKLGVNDLNERAKDLTEETDIENKLKDKVLKEIEDLLKEKDKLQEEMDNVNKEVEDLDKEQEEFEKETKEVEEEIEEVKKEEAKIEKLKEKIEDTKPEEDIKKEIALCEDDLKNFLSKVTGISEVQEKLKDKVGGFKGKKNKIFDKVKNLKLFQNKLKLPRNGIPIANKAIGKLDKLLGKANKINTTVEAITGKETNFMTKINSYDEKLTTVKELYDSKVTNIDGLKSKLLELIKEKSGIKDKLELAEDKADELETLVDDFIQRYNIFDEEKDCDNEEDLDEKIEEIEKAQEEVEPEIEEVEKELEQTETETDEIETETKEVEKEIEQDIKEKEQAAEQLKKEEEIIKEEYGTEVKLEPVTVEEWSESFEVERPYWDAVFHPDEEVVEGFKGRYFEVRLKDAEKEVKLLFGAGEYAKSKSEFRKKYGSTIGSFVTEALHAMKEAEQDQVKVFIQGSADIVGHETFSGKQIDAFLFEEISILPLKDGADNFGGEAVIKRIPKRNFRNEHLPDLRASYLAEMIKVYSKKFDPIILEGAVKSFKGDEERNAVIYLFIPETLLTNN